MPLPCSSVVEILKRHRLNREILRKPETCFGACYRGRFPGNTMTWYCFCGGAYIYNYTTYFFSLAGVKNAFLGSTILNIIYLVSLCVSFWLIERVGRRPLLIYGFVAMSVLNLLIARLGFLPKSNHNGGNNALVALCSLWECAYSLTIAALGIVCLVEVSSFKLRAKTAAFGSIINSITGLIWSYTIPLMLSSDGGQGWGQNVGFLFAITSALFIGPAYLLYTPRPRAGFTPRSMSYTSEAFPLGDSQRLQRPYDLLQAVQQTMREFKLPRLGMLPTPECLFGAQSAVGVEEVAPRVRKCPWTGFIPSVKHSR